MRVVSFTRGDALRGVFLWGVFMGDSVFFRGAWFIAALWGFYFYCGVTRVFGFYACGGPGAIYGVCYGFGRRATAFLL